MGRHTKPRKPKTDEQKAYAAKRQKDFVDVVRKCATMLKKPYSEVSGSWSDLEHLAIGLVMGDPETLEMARKIVHKRYPPMSFDDALGMAQWFVRKVRDPDLCREAFDRAMRLLDEDDG